MILPGYAGETVMMESLIQLVAQSPALETAASHSPQAAMAALLCAALVNFFG